MDYVQGRPHAPQGEDWDAAVEYWRTLQTDEGAQFDVEVDIDATKPEIKLAVSPGMGGSQRLTRAIGKAKAMDMILTGRQMKVDEAERLGLVSRVVPADECLATAKDVASTIASKSLISVYLAKDAVNRAFESSLTEGVRAERTLFYSTFATDDQTEGMAAFVEKREPAFKHR